MERFQGDRPKATREASCELLGPYQLLTEIARGELTTVHLAKKHGNLGFQRLYAVKRLRPGLSRDLDCVELLLDEARLVSGIQHANIAGVLDVGADAGSFVVLEYIEGESLEALLARAGSARDPRFTIPPFVDALHGLHAMHTAADDEGNACGLVHQAPRARHILVGVDGTARLVDFSQVRGKGVRPSRRRSERLKVAYMAPEQALSPESVDLRADLFVVGVALWEALTGERLFAADTDAQTFQNMLHRRIVRPSEVGLKPPRCFDAICLRALERDPKNRYGSALDMARELRDTALNQALYATSGELGAWVRRLAGAELRERRKIAGSEISSSASGISLDTPTLGLDVSGLVHAPQQPAPAPGPALDDNPYATGRIYGGSYARVSLEDAVDDEPTPAFGTRRSTPPSAPFAGDEAPTRTRALPNTRAHAPTVPVLDGSLGPSDPGLSAAAAKQPAGVARSAPMLGNGLYGLGQPQPGRPKTRDADQTQPTVFVPARPGGRRDVPSASPGAYSQVERPRRERASSLPPSALGSLARATPSGIEAPSAPAAPHAATAGGASPGEPTANHDAPTGRYSVVVPPEQADAVLRAKKSSEPPARPPMRGGVIEQRELRRGSAPDPREEPEVEDATPRPRTSSVPPPAIERYSAPAYPSAVTETAPTYIQRRDSQPTRLPIPDGPVGAPLRPFAPAQMPPSVHVDSPRESDELTPTQARLLAVSADGVSRISALPLLDSLTPPVTATLTRPPTARPKSRFVMVASGLLAGIIVLAVAVGLRQQLFQQPQAAADDVSTHAANQAPAGLPQARVDESNDDTLPGAPAQKLDAGAGAAPLAQDPASASPAGAAVERPSPGGLVGADTSDGASAGKLAGASASERAKAAAAGRLAQERAPAMPATPAKSVTAAGSKPAVAHDAGPASPPVRRLPVKRPGELPANPY